MLVAAYYNNSGKEAGIEEEFYEKVFIDSFYGSIVFLVYFYMSLFLLGMGVMCLSPDPNSDLCTG